MIDSQEMILTVQVNVKGYRSVEALKDICVEAKDAMERKTFYSGKRLTRMKELITEILDLP